VTNSDDQPSQSVDTTRSGDVLSAEKTDETPQGGRALVHAAFSGPIPPPELMEGYQRLIPDAPERILSMAEDQSRHRQECEKKQIDAAIKDTRRGQWMGFICAILMLMIVGYLAVNGAQVASSIFGVTGIAAVVIAFRTTHRPKDEPEAPTD